MMQADVLHAHVRYMIRRDMAEVDAIEAESFDSPWSKDDFSRCLRQRNCIGMIAEHDDRVVGFMVYELHKTRLHLLNFAVHPEFRRRGVGTRLIDQIKSKLSVQQRVRIKLEVRETNLAAQLFFRQLGFQAIAVLPEFFEDVSEDAYVMQFRYRAPFRVIFYEGVDSPPSREPKCCLNFREASRLLDRLIADRRAIGGRIEENVDGRGWVVREAKEVR